jgi:hypothetical protein
MGGIAFGIGIPDVESNSEDVRDLTGGLPTDGLPTKKLSGGVVLMD